MQDDLYVPASRAGRLVENIQGFLTGNPVDDRQWDEMMQRLEAIQVELIQVLQENEQATPEFTPVYAENPYL